MLQSFKNNIQDDPFFYDEGNDDYRLKNDSQCIDAGGPLTFVHADDSGSGDTLVVKDAWYFQDGWGMTEPPYNVQPDWIAVNKTDNVVQISSIDYSTNAITLTDSISRNDGDGVWLYKDSSGRRVLYGEAPDTGAYELTGDTPPCTPMTTAELQEIVYKWRNSSVVNTLELIEKIKIWKEGCP